MSTTKCEREEISASRRRLRSRLARRERVATLATAGAFVAAAVACMLVVPSERNPSPYVIGLLIVLYAVVSQIEFETGPGSAVPTELVLVPMLFVLRPGSVPLCVAAGLLVAGASDRLRGRMHTERGAVLLCSSWHSVGPALVVGIGAPGDPAWSHAAVYVLALGAQLALDAASVVVRHAVGRGVPVRRLVAPMAWVLVVDCALAPLALAAVLATAAAATAVLVVLPLAGLLYLFERDRRSRIDEALALDEAVEDASRAARLDPLTGVGNRLAWDEALARTAAADAAATIVLVDLNDLKEVNDTYGHDAGDRLIQSLASTLRASLPEAELARIGGDEFAAVVTGERARPDEVLAHVRDGLLDLRTIGRRAVSASFGVASSPPHASLAEAVRAADERLYLAKARARAGTRAAAASGP
jgi:diguanylate cyclase (GGDEF)-like protein